MLDCFDGCMHTEVKMLEFFLYGMAFEARRHTGEV